MGIIGIIIGLILFFAFLMLVTEPKRNRSKLYIIVFTFTICIAMIIIDATAPVTETTKRELITTEFNGFRSEVPIVIEVTEYEYPWYSAFHERIEYKILGAYNDR